MKLIEEPSLFELVLSSLLLIQSTNSVGFVDVDQISDLPLLSEALLSQPSYSAGSTVVVHG